MCSVNRDRRNEREILEIRTGQLGTVRRSMATAPFEELEKEAKTG